MDVVEVLPGLLYQFRFPVGQAYLWRDQDSLTLIDSGPPGQADSIAAAVGDLGLSLTSLRQIILTHYHEDHVGSAAALAARSGARVLAHRADALVIRGEMPGPPPEFTAEEKALHEQIMAASGGLPPAPLMLWLVCPTAVSMAAACSIDQPLTRPDGSNSPPGRSVK